MKITLNGRLLLLEKPLNIDGLISKYQLSGQFAVEINHSIIPRSSFANYKIKAGDKIEIVEAIGGG